MSGERRRRRAPPVLLLLLALAWGPAAAAGAAAARRRDARDAGAAPAVDEDAQQYLTRFGYMTASADGAFALRTEESVRKAVRDLQRFAGIPVTGHLDDRTRRLMSAPRCGLPDEPRMLDVRRRRKRYAIHGQKWPYTNLTWSLRTKNLNELNTYEVRVVISRALEVWSRHSRLTFAEVESDRADILIYFYKGDHGDKFPFDGRGVILAHAFFPTGLRQSTDVHFDADESWTTSGDSEQGTNLFMVAAHEFGHALGLSHSNVHGALMYPWYTDMKDGFNYELPQDDRHAIQTLYGTRERQWERIPDFRPVTTTTTTTTTTRPTKSYYTRPQVPYNPRTNHGRHPYPPSKPDNPQKPMHPDKKPHYPNKNYPYDPNKKHIHHKHTPDHFYPGRMYPTHPTHPTRSPAKFPERNYPEKTYPGYGNTPKEYPVGKKTPPDTCDTSYDAVAVIRREVFIFKDAYFWRIGDNGMVDGAYPAEITRLWRGFPRNLTHVDAVYERTDGKIVFFVNDKYYVFSETTLERGYPRPISHLGLPESVKKIDGAMVWGHNGKTYFYSGDMYWKFDEEIQKVELDYPRNMAMWKGVGTDIDAVFQWKDGRTYFFKGKGFWKFNDNYMRVEHAEPKLSAPVWMGCTKNFEDAKGAEKLPLVDASATYSGSSVPRIGAAMLVLVFALSRL